MSAADMLAALVAANLAMAGGILVVIVVRGSVRRLAGPRIAYALWLIPMLAGLATLLPARPVGVVPSLFAPIQPVTAAMVDAVELRPAAPAPPMAAPAAPSFNLAVDPASVLLPIWAAGAVAMLALTVIRQRRSLGAFGTIERDGMSMRASSDAGPALVGVIFPQLVVPADFEQRFSEQERRLILAHERAHLSSGDTRTNALVALLTCINWFNPLVHIAARLVRTDQELACDAAVVERFPGERRIYAEALLKTQLAPALLPLGCTWPPRSSSILKERVMMLARQSPGRVRRIAGVSLVAVLAGALGLAAWAAQPPPSAHVLERAVSDSPVPQPTTAQSEMPENWKTHLQLMAELLMAHRDRVIPLDHIVEASVTAETHNGDVLGPYRMYSSLPNDMRSSEFANGDKGFNADGDERFTGAVLGSADVDGGLLLDFGLVIDGDPIVVERLKAQSGASVTIERNGLKLTIHPVLRPMTDAELKRRIPGRTANLEENSPAPVPQPQSPASLSSEQATQRAPDEMLRRTPPSPEAQKALDQMLSRQPPSPETQEALDQMLNTPPPSPEVRKMLEQLIFQWPLSDGATITCDNWNAKYTNDPKVSWEMFKPAGPVTLTIEADGKAEITTPRTFPADLYPVGAGTRSANYYGDTVIARRLMRSDFIENVTFTGLNSARPRLQWQRIRLDESGPYEVWIDAYCHR